INLTGKVAIVTGAARGLGEGCVRALAEKGAAVLVTDVLVEAGESTAASLRAEGFKAAFMQHDVRDLAQWLAVWQAAEDQFGTVDILVNNAGIAVTKNIEDLALEEFRRIADVNLFGVFTGMKLAVEKMKNSGGGSIVNVASNTTIGVVPNAADYSPTKAAVANLTKVVALHCAQQKYNIRVNSVHPGVCDTEMVTAGKTPEMIQIFANANPLGRLGKPIEIGHAVAFLASDDASFITGAELVADGATTVSQL
ncbi:MAG: glucose 1-dehydrogenase, partial [bacterium]